MTYFTDIDQPATAHGFTLIARIEPDYNHDAPWEECDGHGPVSDWTTRDKEPGELVLSEDRYSRRYYDFAEACRIARCDGWGAPFYGQTIERGVNGLRRLRSEWFTEDHHVHFSDWTDEIDHSDYAAARDAMRATMTARQYAAAAARADYERLRAWCNDEWSYVGVIVTASRNDVELGSASVWGIESDAGDYLLETANELAADAIAEARETIAALTE
jgi:hypothetical protein